MPDRIDGDANHYGWMQDKWFSAVYAGNQRKYSNIMHEKYNGMMWEQAKKDAINHRQTRRIVDFVFKNQNITFRNIGILFEGFSAWASRPNYKIAGFPAALRGAILVDNGNIKTLKETFYKKEYVRSHSQHLDKFEKVQSGNEISILTRKDLAIVLFAQDLDDSILMDKVVVPGEQRITLRNKTQIIELKGFEIRNYCRLPIGKIRGKFFFVIKYI